MVCSTVTAGCALIPAKRESREEGQSLSIGEAMDHSQATTFNRQESLKTGTESGAFQQLAARQAGKLSKQAWQAAVQ